MISIIAAMDEKRGIGKDNKLLFKIPKDFERMKKLTMGHPIVMGRKTFESIGRVLPGRTNIVITKNLKIKIENAIVVHSLEKGIEEAREAEGSDEIFIFGGGEIFIQAFEKGLVDRLYLTIVEGNYQADTFFPDYSEFKRVTKEEIGEYNSIKFKFVNLEK